MSHVTPRTLQAETDRHNQRPARSDLPRGSTSSFIAMRDDPRLWSALIVLVTCVVFSPLFTSDFINIDDPQTIATNHKLNPPTLASLLEFWDLRKPQMDLYVPVTYTVWSALARVAWLPTPDAAGLHLNPWMFHGTNVILHALSALVVFQILRMLLECNRSSNGAPVGSAPRTDSRIAGDGPDARLAAPLAGRGAPSLDTTSGPRLASEAAKQEAPRISTTPIAAAGALLFALHPVQAEPVGWASGTKDVLYGLLSLVAIWLYLRSIPSSTSDAPDLTSDAHLLSTPARPGPSPHVLHYSASPHSSPFRSPSWYWLATLAFILAMLSKPTAVVTPLIAATLDLLVRRRRLRDVTRALWPWMLLIIPVIIEGRLVQPAHHPGDYVVPLQLRPMIAADALAFYLCKLLWPANLAFIYNRSPQTVISHGWLWWTWIFPVAAAIAVLVPVLRLRFRGPQRRSASDRQTASGIQADLPREPGSAAVNATIDNRRSLAATLPLVALAIFAICVLPVLGLVPFDFQQFSTTADHYLYLAMLGPALGVAFVLEKCVRARAYAGTTRPGGPGDKQFLDTRRILPVTIICIALLGALGVRTFFQTGYWHDSFSLLEHAIAENPDSPYLYDNLSKAYADDNLPEEARRWDEESVRRWPDRAGGHLNLASDLMSLNRPAEAEAQFEAVLRLDPTCLPAQEQLARLRQHSTTSR